MDSFDVLIDRDTAAFVAKVKPSAVTSWASRGWIDPGTGERRKLEAQGRDWQGRHLYRHGDVLAAEQATRRRGRRRDWAALNVNSSGMARAS